MATETQRCGYQAQACSKHTEKEEKKEKEQSTNTPAGPADYDMFKVIGLHGLKS